MDWCVFLESGTIYKSDKTNCKDSGSYLRKEEDIRKGIGDVMGGKVLELESERLKAEGEARLGTLINRLIQDQRTEEIQIVSTDPEKREQLYKEYGI